MIADDYLLIMEDNFPEITTVETLILCIIFNRYITQADIRVMDSIIENAYASNEKIRELFSSEEHARDLIARIRDWPIVQRLSLVYHIKSLGDWIPEEDD